MKTKVLTYPLDLLVHNRTFYTFLFLITAVCCCFLSPLEVQASSTHSLKEIISELSQHPSRRTGTDGYEEASKYIYSFFESLGFDTDIFNYPVPVRQFKEAHLTYGEKDVHLTPFQFNAITPQTTDGVITGPLYYVGAGKLSDLDHLPIQGSIILIDFQSGQNWQRLASLGAKAIIYVDDSKITGKQYFKEKQELSPLQLPSFWMDKATAIQTFGGSHFSSTGLLTDEVTLSSTISWQEIIAKNVYCFVPGTDSKLSKELLVVEAFYDSTEYVANNSPGAEEAASIATLLSTAQKLKNAPPGRSILLVATSGHMQTLAGMRELIWSIHSKKKELRKYHKSLTTSINEAKENLDVLSNLKFPLQNNPTRDEQLRQAIAHHLKQRVDTLSRELVQLRLKQEKHEFKKKISSLVSQRFALRRLGWAETYDDLLAKELLLLQQIIPRAMAGNSTRIENGKKHLLSLSSAMRFREKLKKFNLSAFISLHLSSHGQGVGGFHQGWLYKLKPNIHRTGIYSKLSEILEYIGNRTTVKSKYVNSLRSTQMRSWDTWLPDKPFLGGEVSSLAGYLGMSLVTVGDARELWGTPWDTIENIDWEQLSEQAHLITTITQTISWEPHLTTGKLPKDGFSTITGRANLLLQGELFANFPAFKTTLLAYQGAGRFYATVDSSGIFRINGVANKKNVYDKVIIEGYRFNEVDGRVIWAIDKKETGKKNYRLKMRRNNIKTDLILFSCKETTIFDLLEPRNFNYLTKMEILDGRRDATPQHYWYSRIDTRESIISSIYMEPGSWLKLTLSDSVLSRKLILTNSSPEKSMGTGYPVDRYSSIPNTILHAAKDAWEILTPRIENLESHGIFDDKINTLKKRGLLALSQSQDHLRKLNYTQFRESSAASLALAARVYNQVEKTQKDVLFGVLFYIALFVPFAFCIERFLFNYANIYKRIGAFSFLLLSLITVIYHVHPAFQLAYSPMVVILAFFIIGLSLMVTLIIFFRFEEEMILLQRRSTHKRPSEISHWKAFVAAFFLGVSNLRRRKIRTLLTCFTLVILTFTIMSFTTVKSNRKHNRILYNQSPQYSGILLKTINWKSLPRQTTNILNSHLQTYNTPAPRVWLEANSVSQTIQLPVANADNSQILYGLMGLSSKERDITGIDKTLVTGRWITENDVKVVLLEKNIAINLGITQPGVSTVTLWGIVFKVIGTFDGELFDQVLDLDGEPLTPVIFPDEASTEISEVEQEALESGDDIRSLQSRYRHIPASQCAIIPAKTLLALDGKLKSIAVKPHNIQNTDTISKELVDRFSLSIFAGEKNNVWLYSPSNTMQYSGVPNIIIPILISICIVLNTMISSVYERKNEIAVYTSVGLAPSHVSFLFVAEAMALAVISVVLGYLVAQVSAAIFSATPYWQGITVNYSSLSGVAAMLLVIGVVLISVIYPSRVAAKIAIPDVKRAFKLPAPIDNTIVLRLPFYMKYQEHESIGGFILDYFSGHQDISHGLFSTGPVDLIFSCSTVAEIRQMIQQAPDPSSLHCMHIRSKVWLAPFDFGIMQNVDIQFCPAKLSEKYLEIQITLERLAGEFSMWQRINIGFLHDLRKQLLVWRSIDDEGHKYYEETLRNMTKKTSPKV